MMKFVFLALALTLLTSCASSKRAPSSIEEQNEASHEQYEGYFDRPVQ